MTRKISKYFIVMAELIRGILNKGAYSDKDFQSVLYDFNNSIMLEITQNYPELINEKHTPNTISLDDLNENLFDRLDNFKTKNVYYQILLLYYMDRAIEDCYVHNCNFEDDIEQFDALNDNIKDTNVAVIKKTRCCWEHTLLAENLNNKVLSVFYYIDYEKLKNTHVINHVIDIGLLTPKSEKCYKFAISPVTKKEVLCLSEPYRRINRNTGAFQNLFRVENLKSEEELTGYVLDNIIIAGSNNVDILVFPEMLGSFNMLQYILSEIKDKKCTVPELIVFPSIWEKTKNDEQNTNCSYMILNGQEVLFQQKKYCNFKYKKDGKNVYEDINDTSCDAEIHLLHVEGLGRICIIICYDYLEAENREKIINNLYPTLICSPSFSTGSFDFRLLAQNGIHRNCNWIWCNTCSAVNHTDRIQNFEVTGIITRLSRHCDLSKVEELQKDFPGMSCCKKVNCDHCIYYTEIQVNEFNNIEKV